MYQKLDFILTISRFDFAQHDIANTISKLNV